MKLLLLLFLGYYTHCQGLQDSLLKSALHDTICTGERYHYGTKGFNFQTKENYTGTWNYLPIADMREDGTIWDMYSNSRRYYPNEIGESACGIQIEHCMPKSWWGADTGCKRAYQDLFNLNPADARANNHKSNYPPGDVRKGDKFDNGSFRMDSKTQSAYGWPCFEPADEYKGDFARAYFYIATAYEDVEWVSSYLDYMTNDSYLEFQPWLIEVLLKWHRQDPVSEKEIRRASVITSVQHNHNPYIDYPELVEYIWGEKKGEKVDFEKLTCTYTPDYQPIEYKRPISNEYDTLIALPCTSKSALEGMTGSTLTNINNSGSSTGTRAVNIGTSSEDGKIEFGNPGSESSTTLVFRASPYATATAMQLDVYADGNLVTSIQEEVIKETRNEVYYSVEIPKGTKKISMQSPAKKRACMQEMYLLRRKAPTNWEDIVETDDTEKRMENGHIVIYKQSKRYSITGMTQ